MAILARKTRRFLYPILSVAIALGLWLGQPIVAQAIPWVDLIIRGVQIVQLSSLGDQQEVALGRQINAQLVGSQVRISRDRNLTNYINQIGQRLAAKSTRPNIPYTFQVVDNDAVNAFATMGGFVYVHTGLIRTADNEAQLASVIGHEIGHVAARHAVNQMKDAAIAGGVATAAGLDRNKAVAIGVDLALNRPNSRRDEFQADDLGLKMLTSAGYAPSAMPAFMTKLIRGGGGSVPTFLSTHPATQDRVARLNQAISGRNATVGDGLDSAAYQRMTRSVR